MDLFSLLGSDLNLDTRELGRFEFEPFDATVRAEAVSFSSALFQPASSPKRFANRLSSDGQVGRNSQKSQPDSAISQCLRSRSHQSDNPYMDESSAHLCLCVLLLDN